MRGTQGLAGQIIINAGNTNPPGLWQGDVIVGEDALSAPITIGPNRPAASGDQAPFYRRTPASLGGGFIGLAPFHLYETACTPPHNDLALAHGVVETAFNNTYSVPVLIQHYGPLVKIGNGSWTSRVHIECRPSTVSMDPCVWFPLSGAFIVRGPGDANWPHKNAIGLSRTSTVFPKAGIYRVILLEDRIGSKEVVGTPSVVWPLDCANTDVEAEAYVFKIEPDCDNDGFSDLDPNHPPNMSVCPKTCRVDVDHDGTIAVADLFEFLNLWFAGDPVGDWNGGGLSVQDIFDYLTAWFNSGGLDCS